MDGKTGRGVWRRAFLRALARGTSIAQAAREAGIDPASAHHARKRDAAFARAWAAAREKGVVRLKEGEPRLRPDQVVRLSADGRPRVQRAGPGRWSQGKEDLFLEVLAATANVSEACRAVRMSNMAVYARRERSPAFAARWAGALAVGWRGLEALMLEGAVTAFGGHCERAAAPGAQDVPGAPGVQGAAAAFVVPMTVDQAITVYRMHQARVTGEGKRPRHDWRRETSMEDVRREVLKRLKAMGR